MYDKNGITKRTNKDDPAGDHAEEETEYDEDIYDEDIDMTPVASKKYSKDTKNKKKKCTPDEGRDDADYVEKQMFHAKQVNQNLCYSL